MKHCFFKKLLSAALCIALLSSLCALSSSAEESMTRLDALIFIENSEGAEIDETYANYNPFSDVPEWAEGYVGYGYKRYLTYGVSETSFDCDRAVTRAEFLTMVLRSLGFYQSKFTASDKLYERAYLCGIYDYEEDCGGIFTKDEAINIMAKAFFAYRLYNYSTFYEKVDPIEEIAEAVKLEAESRSPYRDSLSRTSAGIGSIYYKKELNGCMIIFAYSESPHGAISHGFVTYKEDGKRIALTLPRQNPWKYVMPQEIWLSDDETTLYFTSVLENDYSYDGLLCQRAGTYEYSFDLTARQQNVLSEP